MQFRIWPAIVALAAMSAAPVARAQEARCEMKLIAELPVVFAGRIPLIEGAINGKPVRILPGIAESATVMTSGTAEALGLKAVQSDNVVVYDSTGRPSLSAETTVETFRFAGTEVRNQKFQVWSGDAGAPIMLGRGFWGSADVEFDLAHNAIRLFRPVNCAGKPLAYWGPDHGVAPFRPGFQPGQPFVVEVKLNGKIVGAELDASRQVSVVTTAVAKEAGIDLSGPGAQSGRAVDMGRGRTLPTWVATFANFALADESINNAKLAVSDAYVQADRTPLGSRVGRDIFTAPQMLLGADFLRSHRVLISNSQKRIYFSYVGGPVFQTAAPASATP